MPRSQWLNICTHACRGSDNCWVCLCSLFGWKHRKCITFGLCVHLALRKLHSTFYSLCFPTVKMSRELSKVCRRFKPVEKRIFYSNFTEIWFHLGLLLLEAELRWHHNSSHPVQMVALVWHSILIDWITTIIDALIDWHSYTLYSIDWRRSLFLVFFYPVTYGFET